MPRAVNREAVREIRNLLGVEQADLAGRCGITQSMLSRIESGERDPSPKVLRALADQLGVATLSGVGADGLGAAFGAAGALLRYAQSTQGRGLQHEAGGGAAHSIAGQSRVARRGLGGAHEVAAPLVDGEQQLDLKADGGGRMRGGGVEVRAEARGMESPDERIMPPLS